MEVRDRKNGRSLPINRRIFNLLIPLLAVLVAACGGGDDNSSDDSSPQAYGTWAGSLSDLNEDLSFIGFPAPAVPTLARQTVRQIAHVSSGGTAVKIRFSNLYGTQPVSFEKVRVARSLGASSIDAATDAPVTFQGSDRVSIPAGEEIWSDETEMAVEAGANLAVSIYVEAAAEIRTAHRFAVRTNYVDDGDKTRAVTLPTEAANRISSSYWMRDIAVVKAERTNVVVTFGDSITDGNGSTADANRRYPDLLSERFLRSADAGPVSVVNVGLGGNRWLHDRFGLKGAERFERDVLSVPGVSHAIVLLGINDIGFQVAWTPAETVTAEALTKAIGDAVEAGRRAGVAVYLATILPFKGAGYHTADGEKIRQAVNDWIRADKTAAGIIDLDAAMQDPDEPLALFPLFDSGDHLHPSDAGYQRMADAVDLSLFR